MNQKSNPTEIALCAIVKDEAHCLQGMLSSVIELVSEIIVVDTGSSDASAEIARTEGARVESFTWANDFSAARNFSLSLATKPWILVLDADERLEQTSIPLIKQLTQGVPSACSLNRIHYVPASYPGDTVVLADDHPARSLGANAFFSTHDIRLLPNDPRVQFRGAVHESAEDAVHQSGFAFPRVDVTIHHYGHLAPAEQRHKKALFYLSLAEKKAFGATNDWRAWFQLGVEYQALNRDDDAITAFQRSIQLFDAFAPTWRQLGISQLKIGNAINGLSSLKQAFVLNEKCPITWCALGAALLDSGDLQGAEHCFQTIATLAPDSQTAKAGLAEIARRKQPSPS